MEGVRKRLIGLPRGMIRMIYKDCDKPNRKFAACKYTYQFSCDTIVDIFITSFFDKVMEIFVNGHFFRSTEYHPVIVEKSPCWETAEYWLKKYKENNHE